MSVCGEGPGDLKAENIQNKATERPERVANLVQSLSADKSGG